MTKYIISNELSQKGIARTIRKLEILQKKFPQVEYEFKKRSLDYIEKRARYYIRNTTGGSQWYQITHTLENSWIKDYDIGKLINYCWYSGLVEFGTGIKGQGTHPDSKGYQYDINGHGDSGWYFDYDGKLHFTTGMEAHRYMFNAIQDYVVGKEYKKIFEKSFNTVMGGILK